MLHQIVSVYHLVQNCPTISVLSPGQHYPLYRESDAGCTGLDAAPLEERHQLFQERYDVLSQEASHRVSEWHSHTLQSTSH